MDDCIFCKIANREIPKEFTYEDEEIMVFPDIHPQKPVHLLIVPKKHIHDFSKLETGEVLDKVRQVIQTMIREFNLNHEGFRIVINGGGAQVIDHLHFHLMGPTGRA
ncbi:MAG TPA: HIT domain-containing protein [Patescibacteria group bacterium]